MIDLQRTMCHCNDVTAGEIVEFIKANGIKDLDTLVEQDDFAVGNACQTCREEGFDDDGFSLQMLIEAVNNGKL